jgi:hypothetical protein
MTGRIQARALLAADSIGLGYLRNLGKSWLSRPAERGS